MCDICWMILLLWLLYEQKEHRSSITHGEGLGRAGKLMADVASLTLSMETLLHQSNANGDVHTKLGTNGDGYNDGDDHKIQNDKLSA